MEQTRKSKKSRQRATDNEQISKWTEEVKSSGCISAINADEMNIEFSPSSVQKELELVWNDSKALPWAGGEPRKMILDAITGPRIPSFYKPNFEVELLSIDENSVCSIRILDLDAIKTEGQQTLDDVMKSVFSKRRVSPVFEDIQENCHYMAMAGNCRILRVRVLKKGGVHDDISCWDIDNHEPVKVPFYNIFILRQSGLLHPRQVINCTVYGLDFFDGTNIVREVLLSQKTLPKKYKCQLKINREIPAVHLIDLLDASESVIKTVRDQLNDLCKLTLPTELTRLALCYVDGESGTVFMHELKNMIFNKIEGYLAQFNPKDYYLKLEIKEPNQLQLEEIDNPNKIFIAKFEDVFSRVKVLNVFETGKVEVHYIDYGNRALVPFNEIFQIHKIDGNIPLIPPQCLQGKLKGIGCIENMDTINKYLGSSVFLQVENISEAGQAEVTLFTKNDDGTPGDNINEELLEQGVAFVTKPEPLVIVLKPEPSIVPRDESSQGIPDPGYDRDDEQLKQNKPRLDSSFDESFGANPSLLLNCPHCCKELNLLVQLN